MSDEPGPGGPAEPSVRVHLLPGDVDPDALRGGCVVVIDNLRASVTICAALRAGAARVVAVASVEEARRAQERLLASGAAPGSVLLGGERGGVLIPGFDLANSPGAYTPERVSGRTVVFTTTNGTAALLHARHAGRVLVGCLANLSRVVAALRDEPRPVHVLCAGTRGRAGLDDALAGGAIADALGRLGRELDDTALLCAHAWRSASASPGGVGAALHASRGGRDLDALGLGADVDDCARVDGLGVLAEFDPATRGIVAAG